MRILKNRLINKDNITSLIAFLILLSTQFIIKVPNPISISNRFSLQVAALILSALGFYVIIYRLLFKKRIKELNKSGRYILITTIALLAYYFISIAVRYLIYQRLTISIVTIEVLLFGIIIYVFIKDHNIKYNAVLRGLGYFLFVINLWCILSCIATGGTIRGSSLLSNINVYVGFCFITFPLLMNYYIENINKLENKILLISSFLTTSIFILSGSRFGIWVFMFEILFCLIFIIRIKFKKTEIGVGAIIFLATFCIVFGMTFVNPQIEKDMTRTLEVPQKVMGKILKIKVPSSSIDGNENLLENQDPIKEEEIQDENLVSDDPDQEKAPENGIITSLTRNRIHNRVDDILTKHWVLGVGRHAVYFYGWGYQSPHNYLSEIVMCYGAIGGIFYLLIALYPILYFIQNRKRTRNNKQYKLYLIGYTALFGFSMLEPLMIDKILILILIWGLAPTLDIFKSNKEIRKIRKRKLDKI